MKKVVSKCIDLVIDVLMATGIIVSISSNSNNSISVEAATGAYSRNQTC